MNRPAASPGKVLVTGHDGYVGSALVPFLSGKGYEAAGLDIFYFGDCSFTEPDRPARVLRKDVRDLAPDDLQGFDAVVHLAALSNDPMGELDPGLTLDINCDASVRLARSAKEAGVRRFLFASSCSLYGKSAAEWVDEGSPTEPLTAYARSKVGAEEAIRELSGGGFSPVFLRFATVFGVSPKLRIDLVVNSLCAWGVAAGEIRVLSDGTPWRPLIHVEDAARAYEFFLRAPEEEVRGRTFNVGFNEQNAQVKEIAGRVAEALPGTEVRFAGRPEKDPRSYRVKFDRFRELSKIEPEWDLKSGIRQLVDAYRRHSFSSRDVAGPKYVRLARLKRLLEEGRLDASLRWRTA